MALQKGEWTPLALAHEVDLEIGVLPTKACDALVESVIQDLYIAYPSDKARESVVADVVASDPSDAVGKHLVVYLAGADPLQSIREHLILKCVGAKLSHSVGERLVPHLPSIGELVDPVALGVGGLTF